MRHLYDLIVASSTIQRMHGLMDVLEGTSLNMIYRVKLHDNFEDDVQRVVHFGRCRVVIVNFGHWPAGWSEGDP